MTNDDFTDCMVFVFKVVFCYYVGMLTRNILTFGHAEHDGFFYAVLNVVIGVVVVVLFPYILLTILCTGAFTAGFLTTAAKNHFKDSGAAQFDYPVAREELFVLGCYEPECVGHACFCDTTCTTK